VQIRPATESDAQAVAGLWTEAYTGRGEGEGSAEPYSAAEFADSARRGVGRALAGLCERRARECGAVVLVLWGRPYQVPAHRLYESLGFRRAPERDSTDPEGPRVVLVRDLGSPP
jgi:ribosomal protein S18 acetylase RimI-like enzyme